MKVIEPTKREVFRAMKMDGCIWCGGQGCECHMRSNMCGCFERTKNRLTRTEYTDEEIATLIEQGQRNEAQEAFDEFWAYVNS